MVEPEPAPTKVRRISRRLLTILVAVVVVVAGVGVTAYLLWFANKPPVAEFHVTTLNNIVVANASASSDPDGSIASYAWDFGDGGSGQGVEVRHTYLAEGNFTITLQVKDNAGGTGSKSQAVRISLLPIPIFQADVNLLNVTVDASQAVALRGTLQGYAWDWGDGSAAGSGRTAYHVYASAGNYTVRLTATDSNGKSASSSQKVAVDPASTIYTQVYALCDPTFQKNWELRRAVYGDLILRNAAPAVEEYPWGFFEGYGNQNTALYCLHRVKSHGVNVPNYNMNTPVFWPYLARYDAPPSAKGSFDTTGDPLANLSAEDGATYDVGAGQTMWLDSFDIGTHGVERVWSVSLEVRYATDTGIGTAAAIQWSLHGGVNQTLKLSLRDTGGASHEVVDWITLSPAAVSTWSTVASLNVTLRNPSSAATVYIDALRLEVVYETPAPAANQGSVDLSWYISYSTDASTAELARLGYMDTSGVDDGFISDLRGTYTMDYNTSKEVFGVTGDPAAWWAREDPRTFGYNQSRSSPLERAWANWFTWNGNLKYDIFDAYEAFFQVFTMELNATVVTHGATNTTVVNFRLVSWGGEVLLARWFYWGASSYMKETGPDGVWDEKVANDDVPSVPKGWNGEENGWWEETWFNATLSTALTYEINGVTAYQFGAGADPGPDNEYGTADDTPNWGWQALNMDYVNDSAHPRSEVRYYWDRNLSYVHTTPGAKYYGQPYVYDVAPNRWNLRPGETLVFVLPRGMMIWYDPAKSHWDPALLAGKGAPSYSYYFAPLTLGSVTPNIGLWDDGTKVLSFVGPYTMPNDGKPAMVGLPSITWVPVG